MILEGPGPVTVHGPEGTEGPPFGLGASLRLALALARRDLALHYRHTRLGVLWGILPPLLAMGAVDLFFGRIAKPTMAGATPYALFLYAGLLPWQFLARSGGGGSGVFLSNAYVLNQVRFPRLVLPLAHVAAGVPDLAIGSLVLAAMSIAAGRPPGLALALLPFAAALLLALSFVVTLLLGSVSVALRDVGPAASFGFQLLFVASPILYPPSAVEGGTLRHLIDLNPVTGVVGLFRTAWLGDALDVLAVLLSLVSTAVLGGLAWWAFRAREGRLADLV